MNESDIFEPTTGARPPSYGPPRMLTRRSASWSKRQLRRSPPAGDNCRRIVLLGVATVIFTLIFTQGAAIRAALATVPGLASADTPDEAIIGLLTLGILGACLIALVRILTGRPKS